MAKKSVRSKPVSAKPASGGTTLATGFSEMSGFEKTTWISLHVLLFLVPLAVSNLSFLGIGGGLPLTYDQFDIVKLFVMRACTLIAIGSWAISMLLRGGKIRFSKVDWLILAFIAWVGITSITSIHPPTAVFGKYRRFEGLISFINYAVVYFLMMQTVDRPSRMRSLMRTLFFSGTIVMLYGALQYVGIEPIKYGTLPFEATRSFATYGNPDLLGGFIVLMLPICIGLALSEDNVTWRTIYWIGTLLTAVVTLTAFTRSAWIGAAVALVIMVIMMVRQRIKPRTEDWVMASVAALAAVLIVVRSLTAASEVMNFFARLKSIFQFGEGSALTRFQIWHAAIDAVKARPIFGFGADTFRLVFPMFKPAAYVAAAGYLSVADNVHNYPLQLASALGIPGVLLLYGLFVWVLVSSAKSAFTTQQGSSRILYSAVWASVVGYLVHLFFGLSVTGTTVFLWVFMGLLIAPLASTKEVRAPEMGVGTLSSVVVVAVVAALFVGNVVYIYADHDYLLSKIGSGNPEERVALAQKAVRLNPYNDQYRAEVGVAYLDWANARLAGQIGDPSTAARDGFALMQKGEESLLQTIRFVPSEYDNYVFLSNLYNSMASYFQQPKFFANAKAIAREGIKVEKYGPAVRLEYARALASTGDKAEAIKQLKYAISLDPAFGQGALFLAEVYKSDGKLREALDVLKAVNNRAPGQPGVSETISSIEASLAGR